MNHLITIGKKGTYLPAQYPTGFDLASEAPFENPDSDSDSIVLSAINPGGFLYLPGPPPLEEMAPWLQCKAAKTGCKLPKRYSAPYKA